MRRALIALLVGSIALPGCALRTRSVSHDLAGGRRAVAAQHLALGDGDLLHALLARHGAGQQLPRALSRDDDEFKPVVFGSSFHVRRLAFP